MEAENHDLALDALAHPAAVVEADGVIFFVNQAWKRFGAQNSGRLADGGVGVNYFEVCGRATGEDLESARAAADGIRRVANGEIEEFTMEYPCHSETVRRWFQLVATRLSHGARRGVLVVHEDITARKEYEERLAEKAALLDKASDAILVVDLEGRVQYWNKSAERLHGWTSEEVLGRNGFDFLIKERAKVEEARKLLMEQKEWTGDLIKLTKSGREVIVQTRWSLVSMPDGTPASILSINTDLTEKRRLESQFMRAQRMESIGTLAGGIAHDLNNILAPIMMGLALLREEGTPEERKELLDTLELNAKRGADLVQQVLSFARGMEGERVVLDPGRLARDMGRVAKETFPKTIAVTVKVDGQPWQVRGDATQLHQVLLNLSVNSRDAMPQGGKVSIGVENVMLDEHYAAMNPEALAGPYVVMSVADTGTGILPENLGKIFEPFFTTKEVGKGTGLGLSTTLGIVRSHGGFLKVDTEPGKGSIFRVYLPAIPAAAESGDEKPRAVELPRGRGELILVVDDEEGVLEVTERTLVRFGYRVLKARNGAEAVGLYSTNQEEIALVLTDMMMPVMDGPATITALKTLNPSLIVVGASGLVTDLPSVRASVARLEHFLYKPYTAEAMLKLFAKLLHGQEATI